MPDTRTRRGLSARQLKIWREYIETAGALRARLDSRLLDRSGLTMGDYGVLLALHDSAGHRIRSSALATQIDWERSRLSHHLGRMEKRGLVRRERCAEDSRGSEVVMTDAGADAFRRSSVTHLQDVHDTFVTALTPAQLTAVEDVTQSLREWLAHDNKRQTSPQMNRESEKTSHD